MYCNYLFFLVWLYSVNAADFDYYYDRFTGQPISEREYEEHLRVNNTFWCTGTAKKCDPNEGRRLDITCTNLEFPTRGTHRTPHSRLLPATFGPGYEPIKKKNGQEMEPARKVRQETLATIAVSDPIFTVLVPHYLVFTLGNQNSNHDTINFMLWRPYCCKPEGKRDPMCHPQVVLPTDDVHQFSNIRCMNQTRPITFQSLGCVRNQNTSPERVSSGSNFLDLQLMYGLDNSLRSFKDGMLKVDVDENGIVWPVSAPDGKGNCVANERPQETRCHAAGPLNSLIGINIVGILFWREHNFIAQKLKEVNPCWSDEKLFTVARDINIAYFSQILYYDLLGSLMGVENLKKAGVLSDTDGFRKTFKKGLKPEITVEYLYAWRWAHTIFNGQMEMMDRDGNVVESVSGTDLTLRSGYIGVGKRFPGVVQALFRQGAGKIDHAVDPIVAETGLGNHLQYAFDLTMADLSKSGLMGIPNYVHYREYCTGKKYETWEDLEEDVVPENIELMKKSHEDVSDVPLMLGIWLEKPIPGGYAPRTLTCISNDQFKKITQYDRHWYESPDRPNAFTAPQLQEVRKIKISRILCDIGDNITEMTPNAFHRIGPENQLTSCENIYQVDYTAWKDDQCECK